MVEVWPYGAFSVNRLGLGGIPPFPLSFSVREASGFWVVHATAAQARELADILTRAAEDTIVVVDLATNSFIDEDYVQWRPSRIAEEQDVSCQARLLGSLASGTASLSEEALAIRRGDLPRLLAGWSPYQLTLVDMPGKPTPERIDKIALAVGTAAHDEPVLPCLAGSRLRYSGHDDCYVTVESADRAVPAALLGRLLALLAGSALARGSRVEVPAPSGVTVTSLIEDSAHWTGGLGAVSEDLVTVNLSATATPWRPGEQLPGRIDRTVIYDVRQAVWRPVTAAGPG